MAVAAAAGEDGGRRVRHLGGTHAVAVEDTAAAVGNDGGLGRSGSRTGRRRAATTDSSFCYAGGRRGSPTVAVAVVAGYDGGRRVCHHGGTPAVAVAETVVAVGSDGGIGRSGSESGRCPAAGAVVGAPAPAAAPPDTGATASLLRLPRRPTCHSQGGCGAAGAAAVASVRLQAERVVMATKAGAAARHSRGSWVERAHPPRKGISRAPRTRRLLEA